MKKVYCLYRVSDPRQVQDNDIPMQRIACHTFAECHGWEIVREFTERGVSGYKLHMEERDAIVQIKEAALLEKRFKKDAGEIDARLITAEARMQSVTEKIQLLQTEIMACLQGQSAFSATQIQGLLARNEREQDEAADTIQKINGEKAALSHIKWENEVLIGKYSSLWSEFESAEQSRQRAILRYFIQKIEISRGYSLEISYHPRFLELFML